MKAWKHFCTITRHRNIVIYHCFRAGIFWQGLFHDLSKYSPTEFIAGVRYYQGSRSPNEMEREKIGYSLAWLHHKGRNRHHFEYWTDYDPVTKKIIPVEIPLRFVKEMFCDRVAASKVYNGESYKDSDSIEYFERGRANRIINQKTSDLLESWLRILAEEGEAEAFKVIKECGKKRGSEKAMNV